MSFSIRTALTGFTLVATFLAALISRSEIFIAIVTIAIYGIILLALPLSIIPQTGARREFCTGFFVLSLGTLIFSYYTNSYDQIANAIVRPIQQTSRLTPYPTARVLQQPASYPDVELVVADGRIDQPVVLRPPPYTGIISGFDPLKNPNSMPINYVELAGVKRLVIASLAILSGLIGGVVIAFIAKKNIAMDHLESNSHYSNRKIG